MKTKRCKGPFQELGGGGGGRDSMLLVWILKRLVSVFINASDEKLLIFASVIIPSKITLFEK